MSSILAGNRRVRFPAAAVVAVVLIAGLLAFPAPAAGADGSGSPDLSPLELCVQLLEAYYPGEYDLDEMIEAAADGLIRALGDPYSDYLTPSEYESLITGLEGRFGGLGIYIDEAADGYIVIIAPIKGTPADLAGLRPGDKIVEVDGEDIRYISASEASVILRGAPGTKIRLGIVREGVQGTLTVELTRAWIEITPVEYEMAEDGLGIVRLTTFNELATRHLDEALAALKAQGARGILLDLRNNGGGLVDEALNVAGRFVPAGEVVVSVQRKDGPPEVHRSDGRNHVGLPVVVLVNGGTASAAEIVAGAIKDNKAGALVGTKTYGKGSIQTVWLFTNGCGLRLTIAHYATPSGLLIEGRGIAPHEVVADPWQAAYPPQLDWYRPIRHMRVGLDVLALEEVLEYLGLIDDTPDGVYGMVSVEAVRAFQKSAGLPVTGTVDGPTATALNRAAGEQGQPRDTQLERALKLLSAMIR